MRHILRNRARGTRGSTCRAAVLALGLASVAACNPDDLLESDRPSTLEAEDVAGPSNAALLVNGAVADFECAHGAFVAASGLMGDELEDAQLAAAVWSYDRRDFGNIPGGQYGTGTCNAQLFGVYRPLATARWSADNAIKNLDEWTDEQVPNRQALIATAATYAGFSLLEMGMIMCSAAIDVGPELQSEALFQEAEKRFDRAIAEATASNRTDLRNAATAGRARARLYLGNRTGAAADARTIPAAFVFTATAEDVSDNRRWNRVFHFVNFNRFHMVAAQSQNLTTGGVADPRTRVTVTTARAVDGRVSVVQNKYASNASPMPITRYAEMQLILAEAEGGQTAIGVVNALRARVSLPAVSGAEAANIQQTVIEERRRELFLEGQRMYDMRRFNIPFTPTAGTTFPKGGAYGETRCLPLPDIERFNNPNID